MNASGLQVSGDVIQESVVLFGVGQGWILVVSFNICQQRPARAEITKGHPTTCKRSIKINHTHFPHLGEELKDAGFEVF